MKVAISIEHPAWIHQFRNILFKLKENNHEIIIYAVEKDRCVELLAAFGFDYHIVGNSTGNNIFHKAFLLIQITYSMWKLNREFKPDFFIGRASPMVAINAGLYGRPHIIYEDTERSTISLFFCKLFSSLIVTPLSFNKNLGKKQLRKNFYKELFYLHPSYFSPDDSVLKDLEVQKGEKFVVLRFVSWNASHDIGSAGLSTQEKLNLVDGIKDKCKVFISSEEELPMELWQYTLKTPVHEFHNLIYYAHAVYTEGASVASEAVMLGTHVVYVNSLSAGTTDEQSKKYDLLKYYKDHSQISESIKEFNKFIDNDDIWRTGKDKIQLIMNGKDDPNKWFYNTIVNYPNYE